VSPGTSLRAPACVLRITNAPSGWAAEGVRSVPESRAWASNGSTSGGCMAAIERTCPSEPRLLRLAAHVEG
jgi:hypothetical protein